MNKKQKAKADKKAKVIKTLKAAGKVIVAVGFVAGTIGYFIQKDNASELSGQLNNIETALQTSQENANSLQSQTKILKEELNKVGLELINVSDASELKDDEIAVLKESVKDLQDIAAADEAIVFVGYDEDLGLGDAIALDLDDNDFEKLADYDVEVDGEDVSVKEYLTYDGEFNREDSLTMTFDEESIKYIIEYDADAAEITEDDSLDISILGQSVEIIKVEDDKLTVKMADDVFATEGQVVNGVEIVKIGESSVIVSVDGEQEVISKDSSDEINDIEIEVGAIFYVEGADDNLVNIKAGKELVKVYDVTDSDDKYLDADEVWKFASIEEGKIVITNDEEFEEVDSVSLPNDFAKISFDVDEASYQDVTVEKEDGIITKVNFKLEDYDSEYAEYEAGVWTAEDEDEDIDFAEALALENSDFKLKLTPTGVVKIQDADGTLVKVTEAEVKVDGQTDFDNDLDFISVDGLVVEPTEDFLDEEDNEIVISVPEETVEATILVE